MTFRTLISRSLRFHARAHAGVVLGAAIGSTALIGALVVGDSVRESLRQRALVRVADASYALAPPNRFFGQSLALAPFYGDSHTGTYFNVLPPSGSWDSASKSPYATLLALPASGGLPSAEARANRIQVYGVGEDFWSFVGAGHFAGLNPEGVVLNAALAAQLGAHAGDQIILRVQKPSPFSGDAAVSPHAPRSLALRRTVTAILPPDLGGDLDLHSSGQTPFNAFVDLQELARLTGLEGNANVVLFGPVMKNDLKWLAQRRSGLNSQMRSLLYRWISVEVRQPAAPEATTAEALSFLTEQVRMRWTLPDTGLTLVYTKEPGGIELRSPGIFLEPAAVAAATRIAGTNARPILTYLANLLVANSQATPYSMVTAAGPPYTPADLRDDEIILTDWLARDLKARPGDTVALSYFLPESGAQLAEATNHFRVRAVVPLKGIYADRTLMPDFPGIENVDNPRDWDAGFPLVYKIRPEDEEYWTEHRGTPKAYVTLAAGQAMWANRFGNCTALRMPDRPGLPTAELWGRFKDQLLATLKPEDLGLRFEPVRQRALQGAEQSQDFGQLFLGFSFFLVLAALLLMALLFQFGLEQRAAEIGTLLALGFTPREVRRLFLAEGVLLAMAGGCVGALAGLGYARAMLWGLTTIWRSAVGASALEFHATAASLAAGFCASTVVAGLTIWLALRKQARQPARELLEGEASAAIATRASRRRGFGFLYLGFRGAAVAAGLGAVAIVGWELAQGQRADAGAFFAAGALLLIAGLAWVGAWLGLLARAAHTQRPTLAGLAVRGCGRRRKRSLATVALLACGCFVIVAIGVFRLDANRNARLKSSGTGGFALIGASALPVVQDLNTAAGRDAFGLDPQTMTGTSVVAFRVREGDEASCLNLDRAQRPRLLGVRPEALQGRFTFTQVAKGLDARAGWQLLKANPGRAPEEVPAIGDANSIQWALGKQVGDTIDYTDESGRPFKLRLVGAVANSILQGNLVIDEAAFVSKFPGQSGYRRFLLDAPPAAVSQVSASLSRALQDAGLELTPAARRLAMFNAVQNTYLGTFQVLGGLGLLLGSAGLGVVVLRNVLERRGELGLLTAVGFQRRALQWLLLGEHGALLGLGLGIGILAAVVAVLPAVLSTGTPLPYRSLGVTLGGVWLNGAAWTWLATRYALRGNPLAALRNE